MTPPKRVLVKHMGHDGPWLLIKTPNEIRVRRANIKAFKPAHEVATRLRRLKVVKEPPPPALAKSYVAWEKADAAWEKADAAREKADAAWKKADAAREKADAAWKKGINSKAGVAFHKKVCGCGWTPEQPDILKTPILHLGGEEKP